MTEHEARFYVLTNASFDMAAEDYKVEYQGGTLRAESLMLLVDNVLVAPDGCVLGESEARHVAEIMGRLIYSDGGTSLHMVDHALTHIGWDRVVESLGAPEAMRSVRKGWIGALDKEFWEMWEAGNGVPE